MRGLAEACRAEGAVLLGGETAEMPDLYREGDFDLAGCMVGWLRREERVDGSAIRPGDEVWALPSTGLHTNGYSLARRILFEIAAHTPRDVLPGESETVGDILLRPHRSYTRAVGALVAQGLVRGMAHVTGGGISGNLSRVLPPGVRARLERASWAPPPLFRYLAERGAVPWEEMERTFNLGVGFLFVWSPEAEVRAVGLLRAQGEAPWRIGTIEAGGERDVVWR